MTAFSRIKNDFGAFSYKIGVDFTAFSEEMALIVGSVFRAVSFS